MLKRNEYEFILSRACIQYDPDEAEYHRITQAVYEHINESKQFDKLISTRHFGPMVFYLVWNKVIDNLLLEYLEKSQLQDAVTLVQLYRKVHLDCKSASMEAADDIESVMNYVQNDSPNTGKLTLALQTFKEIEKEKKKVADNVKKGHGAEWHYRCWYFIPVGFFF